MVLHHYGIMEPQYSSVKDWMASRPEVPRVVLIQRAGTRRIKNLDEVIDAIADTIGIKPLVVDTAKMTVEEQVRLLQNSPFHQSSLFPIMVVMPMALYGCGALCKQVRLSQSTDIMVMVHGGALGNVVFMPYGSVLLDIYPYNSPEAVQGDLIHAMRKSLSGMEILHSPFEVTDYRDVELKTGRLVSDCACPSGPSGNPRIKECAWNFFWRTSWVRVDRERFRHHMGQTLAMWRAHEYKPPLSQQEYVARWEETDRPWYHGNDRKICPEFIWKDRNEWWRVW